MKKSKFSESQIVAIQSPVSPTAVIEPLAAMSALELVAPPATALPVVHLQPAVSEGLVPDRRATEPRFSYRVCN